MSEQRSNLSAVLNDFDKHVSEEFCSFSVVEQTNHEQHDDVLPFCIGAQLSFETKRGFCDDSFAACPGECGICGGNSSSSDGRCEYVGGEPVGSLDDSHLRFLRHEGFGVVGDSKVCESESFHDGLICDSSMSLRVFRTSQSTFLNFQQEMSSHAMLSQYAGHVCHLLSEVAANEGFEWWLLDSGAARKEGRKEGRRKETVVGKQASKE